MQSYFKIGIGGRTIYCITIWIKKEPPKICIFQMNTAQDTRKEKCLMFELTICLHKYLVYPKNYPKWSLLGKQKLNQIFSMLINTSNQYYHSFSLPLSLSLSLVHLSVCLSIAHPDLLVFPYVRKRIDRVGEKEWPNLNQNLFFNPDILYHLISLDKSYLREIFIFQPIK